MSLGIAIAIVLTPILIAAYYFGYFGGKIPFIEKE